MSFLVPYLTTTYSDELETLCVTHPLFSAKILLQGGQLMHFSTADDPNNWLWHSRNVAYKTRQAVRGGVPICFPLFGNLADNPSEVQRTFDQGMAKHGIARTSLWQLTQHTMAQDKITLTLGWQVPDSFVQQYPNTQLSAELVFEFSQYGFNITLNSHNHGKQTLYFSQAFHSYLPIADIHQTVITGFDGVEYVDMLQAEKPTVQQVGDIVFATEVDRIYQASPIIGLTTPDYTANLTSKNSLSTIIWNPWTQKSQTLDQFLPDDFEKMLCIETANADKDRVELPPNASVSLGVNYQKINS